VHEDGPEVKNRSPAFYVQLLLTLLLCAFLILPVIQSILAGLTVNYLIGLRSGLTVQWFRKVWDLYRDSIFRSIGIGLGCLGCTLPVEIESSREIDLVLAHRACVEDNGARRRLVKQQELEGMIAAM